MAKSEEETDAFSRLYKKTEFDNLLLKLGGWSRFQQIQWVLLFLAAVPQAWYTYAPAFAAAKPKEDQIYCIGKPEIEGKSFCAAWQNKTCTDAGYRTPYNSIVTDVSVFVYFNLTLKNLGFSEKKTRGVTDFAWQLEKCYNEEMIRHAAVMYRVISPRYVS